MSWENIMRRILPPAEGVSPHTTSAYGAIANRPLGSTNPHRGVDFNYSGGRHAKLNLSHPALRSPVAGIVTTNPGEGSVGRIAIRDANGFSHEILHTDTQYVKRGDLVGAGQPIGRMGNTGTEDQHVHYQLKDSTGHAIDPTDFWDRLGPAKTDPGQPAYLDEYQQYLRGLGVNAGNAFANAPDAATTPAPGSFDARPDGSAPLSGSETRRLSRRIPGKSQSFFDTGTPAVPFVRPNEVLSPDRQNAFGSRFGDRTPVPAAPPSAAAAAERQESFSDRFGNWTSSPEGITPRNPNLPAPPPEPGRPLGIVSGNPMPLWTTPLPLEQLFKKSDASGDGNWFARLAGIASEDPDQVVPPAGLLGLFLGGQR